MLVSREVVLLGDSSLLYIQDCNFLLSVTAYYERLKLINFLLMLSYISVADTHCKKLIEKAWNSSTVEGIDFKSTGSYQ